MSQSFYKRWQLTGVNHGLAVRRVLLLAGARQCGKTTLVSTLNSSGQIYRTLDDLAVLDAALNDPNGFVSHGDELMIIDEIQRAPILLQAIKMDVDTHQKTGRFLITGSTNIKSLPNSRESLAGRVRKIRLRPLAQGEIMGVSPNFLKSVFQEELKLSRSKSYMKDDYLSIALKGGYPGALRLKTHSRIQGWYKDYIEALMDYDLKDILNIRRRESMQALIYVLAAWSSKFMDISAISASFSVARQTLESYINALEALYIVERVKPWSKTDFGRVSKQSKLFMTDTGLMASVLGWTLDKIRFVGEANGKLIETFVFTQLAAMIDCQEERYTLMHYRDRDKREIDFIIENNEGKLLGVEVKAGSAVTQDSFKHLKWFKENMAQNNPFIGLVFYTGVHLLSFGNGLWAVPLSALWDEAYS